MMKACKRGNIAERDKWGHCLCSECKSYRYSIQKANRPIGYQEEWQKQNKDKIKMYSKKWIGENQEKRKKIVLSWRLANPKKVKEMNAKSGRKWSKNNRGKRNAITQKRRAALLNRFPEWADTEKIKTFYLEAERLTKETGIPHEVDHVIPLQGEIISGLHVHNNLQILSRSQNRSKKNKMEG